MCNCYNTYACVNYLRLFNELQTLPSSPGKKSELLSICNLLSRLFESSR